MDVGALAILESFAPPIGIAGWWWYTWTNSHLIREPLGTSGPKEGTAVAVGG
jgi:hypothetical protein